MGESRTELIAWVNDLLDLGVTKIEQLGTGAAYVQIIDSIFQDLPLSKVKFNAKQEYEYIQNYKQLQEAFRKHKIDKPIPVEKLMKCKMQDNLEFCQWIKKFWDMHFPGGEYDPMSRRKGQTLDAGSAGLSRSVHTKSPTGSAGTGTKMAAKRGVGSTKAGTSSGVSTETLQVLTNQMSEMKLNVEGLEKERDFYFNKLRDIEISVGARLEAAGVSAEEETFLKSVQAILYSTEEGFEVPEGDQVADEEETF
ncbi:hypothetical protein BT69DRAFT_1317910 [Atractiella rhizophila]|nr:hypothetical protein BT69DRAFT_1317910 [Atractiella rhizophila]